MLPALPQRPDGREDPARSASVRRFRGCRGISARGRPFRTARDLTDMAVAEPSGLHGQTGRSASIFLPGAGRPRFVGPSG